jgi:hypothetical protein
VEWLRVVGRRGWAVLTKDDRIRYREAEKRAIAEAQVRAFFLAPRGLTGPENGQVFVRALGRMVAFCAGNRPPFIAKVFASGDVKLWERPRA